MEFPESDVFKMVGPRLTNQRGDSARKRHDAWLCSNRAGHLRRSGCAQNQLVLRDSVLLNGAVILPSTVFGARYDQVSTAYFTAVHETLTGKESAKPEICGRGQRRTESFPLVVIQPAVKPANMQPGPCTSLLVTCTRSGLYRQVDRHSQQNAPTRIPGPCGV